MLVHLIVHFWLTVCCVLPPPPAPPGSRDVDIMDTTLPTTMIQFCGCVATYVSILVVIAIATYWFAIALVPLTILYFIIQRYGQLV